MVKKLDWDSNLFGYPVGLQKINSKEIFDIEKFIEASKNYRLVYIYSDIELNVGLNLELVDKKVIFHKLNELNKNLSEIVEFNTQRHSYQELLDLAYLSGISSRFQIDTNFKNNEFIKLYKQWVDNSINGKIAFKILIKHINNKIAGFITLRIINNGTTQIGLIAVNKLFQGRNIASSLIKECESISLDNGYSNIEVATQFDNKPAIKLYEKNNFSVKSKTYIYHFWNHDTI